MSRQLPPFVHRGSRAPSSAAGSVVGGGAGAGAGVGGGGGRGGSLHPRASATPIPANFYQMHPERRPHPLQQAFYSDDFPLSADDSGAAEQARHVGNSGGGGRAVPNGIHPGSMPPPPPHSHIHGAPGQRGAHHAHPDEEEHAHIQGPAPGAPLDASAVATLVMQCRQCKLIVGDSFSWVDLLEPLGLIILSAASQVLRTDGDVDHVSEPVAESSTAAQRRAAAAAAKAPASLHTSPADAPDAASTWHTLRCGCGAELGRKYVSTSFPHLDALRGNFAFEVLKVHIYELGSYSPDLPDGQHGPPHAGFGAYSSRRGSSFAGAEGQSSAMHAEEMNKMRMLLMNVAERVLRLEDKQQLPPLAPGSRSTPVHFAASTPGLTGSSPAPNSGLVSAFSSAQPHRTKLVPNAQDSFLPPRVVPRMTATPAPASGPSIPTSTSGHTPTSVSSQTRVQPSSQRAVASAHRPNAQAASNHHNNQQDTSPYSSPHTPTPAPASQNSATRAQQSSSAMRGAGSASQPSSPNKRSAIQAASAAAAAPSKAPLPVMNDDEEDDIDTIPHTHEGHSSPAKRRRRDNTAGNGASGSQTQSQGRDQGRDRARGSPVSKPTANNGRNQGRRSGGNAATDRAAPSSSVNVVAASPRISGRKSQSGPEMGGHGKDKEKAADDRNGGGNDSEDDVAMLIDMDDEDDELAIGAEASVVLEAETESDEEEEKVRNGRRRTKAGGGGGAAAGGDGDGPGAGPSSTSSGAGAGTGGEGKGTEDRRAMPPPLLPASASSVRNGGGSGNSSAPRSTKKTIAVA
ncbi:hypothetical protein OC834_001560 [Tilletia horrida]|nr:hypothetical protein OC834_001560 [Tilletia horrida]KAK0536969.1 hypothetical protein OC835_001864 [Tilletia horrida]